MSLLAALKLRPTPSLLARSGAVAKTSATPKAPVGEAKPAAGEGRSPANGGAHGMAIADGSRAEAAKVKAALEQRHRAAYDEWQQLVAMSKKLDAHIDAVPKAQKPDLVAKRKKLAERIAQAESETEELMEHIEALEDPQIDARKMNAILSAHGSRRTADRQEEIDLHPHESKKPGEVHETTTTTAMIDGTAFVDERERQRKVGPGGVTQTDRHATEVSREGHVRRTEDERKVEVSLAEKKVAIEQTRKVEVERPGGLVNSREEGRAVEVGLEGVSQTRTRTVTNSDGSSKSASSKVGVERGDGKVGLGGSATRAQTDADGREKTGTLGGKGGLTAQDGAMGGFAEGTGSVGTQRKSGFNTKASLGLKSNISCAIDGPDEKGIYLVKLDVVLGASLDVGAGRDRKGGSVKATVGAKASKTVTMHREVPVHERDIQSYVDDLKKANAGQKVADATRVELQVIATGASEGWAAAQRLFEGKAFDVGEAEGSSTKLGTETSKGASVGVAVKGVGVSGSHTETHGHGTTATRDAKGGLKVESTTSDASKTSRGASLDTGTTSFGVSVADTVKTTIGYVITIPAGPRQKELLDKFHACASEQDQERFIREHEGLVQVTGKRRATEHGSEKHDTFGLLGADLDLASTAKVSKDVTTDATGKVVKTQVVGESSMGGSAGVGETLRVGDTTKDTATSRHDEQGEVDLDLEREKSSTSLLGKVKGMLFGAEEEPEMIEPATAEGVARPKDKRAKGAIAKAAGGESASGEEHHVYGVKLGKADIAKIVGLANGDAQAWSQCAWGFDRDAIREWSALRGAIASKGAADPAFVADSLAEYVGRDRGERMEALLRLVRPMGNVSIGARNEFPKSVKTYQKVYAELVLKPAERVVAQTAEAEGPEAARRLGEQWMLQLGRMALDIQAAEDFSSAAAKAEMVAAINERKEAISAAMLKLPGADAAQEATARRHDYERVRDQLRAYPKAVDPRLAELADKLGSREYFIGADRLIGKLEELGNLYALWRRDYAKALDLAKKAGAPESEIAAWKPDLRAYNKYRSAARMSEMA